MTKCAGCAQRVWWWHERIQYLSQWFHYRCYWRRYTFVPRGK